MPEMDFLLNEKPSQWPGNIWAVMLYPNDILKRRQWLTVSKMRHFRNRPNEFPFAESAKLMEIIKILVDAPPSDKLFDQKAFNKGIIAGEKLYTILELDRSGIAPSAAKAEYLIDKDGLKSRSGKPIPSSPRSIQKAWKEYHSVAHLWAAYRIYHYLFSDDHFPLNRPAMFLAVSEFFRRQGERITPANQPTPYLNGCDLRLMSVVTPDDLVDKGRSLVIVALIGTDLHIRIFDAGGKKVVDKAEDELVSGETLTALRQRLDPLPDESSLSQDDKQEIIGYATSIAGHTHLNPRTTWKPPENFKLGKININITELSEYGLKLVDEYLDLQNKQRSLQ